MNAKDDFDAAGLEIQAILDGVPSGIAVLRNRRFAWVNPAMSEISGFAQGELIGQLTRVMYASEEDYERVGAAVEKAFAVGRGYESELLMRRQNGELRWVTVRGRLIDRTNPSKGSVWFMQDISELKNAYDSIVQLNFDLERRVAERTAQLTESEARFRSLADSAPVFIWMAGPDKRGTWFNQQWLAFTGRTMAQELGDGWIAGIHPDDVEPCLETYHGSFDRGEPFEMEYRLRSADGRYRWVADRGVPRYGAAGEFLGYVGTCADITERRLAEDALRESQRQLKLFIEGAPVGIAVFDRDMRYLAASRRFREYYHLADTSLVGRSHYEVFPDIPEHWRQVHRRCLAGETYRTEEDRFARADGTVKWMRGELQPWRLANGEIGGIILFADDVTARKRAEDDLRAAKAEAERANDAKSRFLAAVSHDLRQPLSALSLYVSALGSKLGPGDDKLLTNMRDCVGSLSEMLSNLLDLSKLDAGVVVPDASDFPLDRIFTTVASSQAPAARLKGVALRFAYFDVFGHTDPLLFQRIISNLVANAIRYTQQGGVLVGCRRRQGKFWIEVWDTGIGIPADKTAEIFEEFRQLGNFERNRAKGTGLGLTIVAKTAALLGLQIRVRSKLGKGSMFAVELPLGQPVVPAAPRQYQHRPLRIALVEDNADVAKALAYSLGERGHRVIIAATRVELVQLLGSERPDILISDYRLAGAETGVDVVATLRAAFGAHLPAIIVTGDTDPNLIRSLAETGIRLQHKPLDMDTLCAAIAELTA